MGLRCVVGVVWIGFDGCVRKAEEVEVDDVALVGKETKIVAHLRIHTVVDKGSVCIHGAEKFCKEAREA